MYVGNEIGLDLNISKCELISHPRCIVSGSILQSFLQIPVPDAKLGALYFSALFWIQFGHCAVMISLSRAVDRLSSVSSQDALILLRASFSAPRVQHLLCCLPLANNAALRTFDKYLRGAVTNITNSDLTNILWMQVAVPFKHGSLR